MNPLSLLRELLLRAVERKWAMVSLLFLFICGTMCGIIFIKTPTFYEYHLKICDRFLDRVCYSDRSVFLIFIERTAGNVFFLILLLIGGLHPAALIIPATALVFRAYTFGGTLTILFSTYEISGALVAFALYLPIHLMLDILFLIAASLSFFRAFCFRFESGAFRELFFDFFICTIIICLICLIEAFILGVLFHPLGNLL